MRLTNPMPGRSERADIEGLKMQRRCFITASLWLFIIFPFIVLISRHRVDPITSKDLWCVDPRLFLTLLFLTLFVSRILFFMHPFPSRGSQTLTFSKFDAVAFVLHRQKNASKKQIKCDVLNQRIFQGPPTHSSLVNKGCHSSSFWEHIVPLRFSFATIGSQSFASSFCHYGIASLYLTNEGCHSSFENIGD